MFEREIFRGSSQICALQSNIHTSLYCMDFRIGTEIVDLMVTIRIYMSMLLLSDAVFEPRNNDRTGAEVLFEVSFH